MLITTTAAPTSQWKHQEYTLLTICHSQCPTTTATQSERTTMSSCCFCPTVFAISRNVVQSATVTCVVTVRRIKVQCTMHTLLTDRQTAAAAARDDDAVKLGNSRDYKASALFHVTRRRANNLKLNRQSRAFSVKCTVMNPSMDFCLPSS